MQRLSIALALLVVFLLAGCSSSNIAPTTSFQGEVSTLQNLQDKSILVIHPISLKKALGVDPADMVQAYEKMNAEKGRDGNLVEYVAVKNYASIMGQMAQFEYVVADALGKAGVKARPADTLNLPDGFFDNKKRDEIFKQINALGYDYVLITGVETKWPDRKGVWVNEPHYGKNILLKVATLGLSPVEGNTFGVRYLRDYELRSTSTGSLAAKTNLSTEYIYDHTGLFTKGFSAMERMNNDLTKGQQSEIPNLLLWLGSINEESLEK